MPISYVVKCIKFSQNAEYIFIRNKLNKLFIYKFDEKTNRYQSEN